MRRTRRVTTLSNAVPSLIEVRAALRGLLVSNADVGHPATRPDEPDPALLDLAADPFDTVETAFDRLAALERHLRERADRRSVFLTVYAGMTDAMRTGIEAGDFRDPDWVRRYLVAFANRYRAALVADERGESVPAPWRVAFDAARRDGTLVLQDALLGINAHINYDLTYTLCDVGTTPNRPAKLADHTRVNAVLHDLVDAVQTELAAVYAAAGLSRVDALFGAFDEALALAGLRGGRQLAWRNATVRTDLPWRPVVAFVDWRVRTVALGGATVVLSPGLEPRVLDALRRAERGGEALDAVDAAVDAIRAR